MTDNGTATGQNVFNAGMRGRKTSLYEGGHRVPFFVRWPNGGVGRGRDVSGLTRSTDVLPTLIDLCGLIVDDGLAFDGISLANALQESAEPPSERMAVIQYGHAAEGIRGHTDKNAATVLWNKWRLVNGSELYDIATDIGQTRNVAESNPEVVGCMQDYYEQWWEEVGDNLETYQPITVGSKHENPVRLCSCDWTGVYADNQANIRGCVMDSGTWHVEVARDGLYGLTLRRWPEESGLGITASAPVMQGFDGTLPEGAALPVSSAWLRVGSVKRTQRVTEEATHVTLRMALACGTVQIKSWWYDGEGNPLAGAYYLAVESLND